MAAPTFVETTMHAHRIFLCLPCMRGRRLFAGHSNTGQTTGIMRVIPPRMTNARHPRSASAIGLVLLNLVWQLYRCYGAGFDIDTENPTNLVVRSVIFLLLIWYCDDIVNLALQIGGTPYNWILDSNLPGVQFGDFNSVLLVIIGVIANGSVALIALILVMVLAWNYLKLLLEAAERYVVLGVLVFTAPLAFAMGAARGTNNIFKSWCRMFGGQLLLLIMNAWCLKLFVNMVGEFLANPLSL